MLQKESLDYEGAASIIEASVATFESMSQTAIAVEDPEFSKGGGGSKTQHAKCVAKISVAHAHFQHNNCNCP